MADRILTGERNTSHMTESKSVSLPCLRLRQNKISSSFGTVLDSTGIVNLDCPMTLD